MKDFLARLRSAVRRLFHRKSSESDLHDEMQSYLEHETDARIRNGLEPVEARRTAVVEFGGVEQVKEIIRDERSGAWVQSLLRDFRYAFRTLNRSRGFAFSVIGSLSLGIAVTVTAFAFIDALMFRAFPVIERQEELVEFRVTRDCGGKRPCWIPSVEDYGGLREGISSFTSFTGFATGQVAYEGRLAQTVFVFPGYFETLGALPGIGRSLTAEDRDAVVIADSLWKREFSGDPEVVGKVVRIGSQHMKIAGVAPPEFQGLHTPAFGSGLSEFWLPIAVATSQGNWGASYGPPLVRYIGRRGPGIELAEIHAQAEVIFAQVAAARGMVTVPGRFDTMKVSIFDNDKRPLAIAIIMLVPILVLLISCVNAANLLFGRAAARDREIAIRLSIGASRRRVVRQLLIESIVLSLTSAALAVPLAAAALRIASSQLVGVPIPIGLPALAGTLATAFFCAFAFGLAPAMRMTSINPGRALGRTGSPLQINIRRTLVIGQVALSLALLAVGTQLVATLMSLGGAAGVPADRLLMATFNLDQIQMSAAEADEFYRRLADRVAKLPQVEAAGVGPAVWFFGNVFKTGEVGRLNAWPPGAGPEEIKGLRGGTADPGMFQAVGAPLIEGRWFNDDDRREMRPRVAIVNRAFVEKTIQGPAVGRVIRLAGNQIFKSPDERNQGHASALEVTIVGIVENLSDPRYERNGPAQFVYTPTPVNPEAARVLYVRSRGPMDSLPSAVAKAVHEVDPGVPIGTLGSLDQLNYESMPEARLAQGAKAFGLVALVLATFGMYGVMSYYVSQRSREIAIRMALGAEGPGILRMVLKQAMSFASVGALIGGLLAVMASLGLQVMNGAPLGIQRAGFAGSGLLLLGAMLLAGGIPAIRASRVDPVNNLRQS